MYPRADKEAGTMADKELRRVFEGRAGTQLSLRLSRTLRLDFSKLGLEEKDNESGIFIN